MKTISDALIEVVTAAREQARRAGASLDDASLEVYTALIAVTASYAKHVLGFDRDQFVFVAAETFRVVDSEKQERSADSN